METQYKYDNFSWLKNHDEECTIKDGISTQQEDGTVTLFDARCLLGKDPFEITIPDTILSDDGETELRVTEIFGWAFNKCQYIRHLNISKHITLEKFAAYDLPLLESVTVSEENEELASKDGVLYTKDFSKIIYWPAAKIDFSSLSNYTLFADTAFWGVKRDHDSFPIAIREYYKKKSWKLNVEEMTAEPYDLEDFLDTNGNVFLPESVHFAEGTYAVKRVSCDAYNASSDIKNIILPDTIEDISDWAFYNRYDYFTNLTVNVPQKVRSIGSYASISLFGKHELDLPCTLENVGAVAFILNKGVKRIVIPRGLRNAEFIYDFCNLEEIRLKDSLSGEVNLVLVDGVLFTADMKTLLKYPVGKKNDYYRVPDGVEKIEAYAFANNKYLREVELPETLSAILEYRPSTSESEYDEPYPNRNLVGEDFDLGIGGFLEWYAMPSLFPGCDNLKKIIVPTSVRNTLSDWLKCPEKIKEEVPSDKYFRSKELNMYIHVDKDNNAVAKILSCKRKEWLEDYEDEETGEVISLPRAEILSEEYPVEYQLTQDSLTNYWGEYCYGNNVLESISEEEYNAYGQDEVLRLKQEGY